MPILLVLPGCCWLGHSGCRNGHVFLVPIHKSSAIHCPTVARDAFLLVVLKREFVIVAQFLSGKDILLGINGDPFGSIERNDLGVAVGIAAGIDESGHVSLFGCVADSRAVDPKHVIAPNLGLFVFLFPFFRHGIANDFSAVFHHHFAGGNLHVGKDTPSVNAGPVKPQLLFPARQGVHLETLGPQGHHILHHAALIGPRRTALRLFLGILLTQEQQTHIARHIPSGQARATAVVVVVLSTKTTLQTTSLDIVGQQTAAGWLEGWFFFQSPSFCVYCRRWGRKWW